MEGYRPRVPPERVERMWRWHEEASDELHLLGAHEVEYLGLQLHVPAQVFPPTPTSDLLGRAVLARTRGTGFSTWGAAPGRTQSWRHSTLTTSWEST